jgi:signal transduction histidine kinase/DNA-binding response OmpR family regulator
VNESLWMRRLEREKARNAVLERLIEDKTRELFCANEELRKQNETLELRVAARTVSLREALAAAEAANRAKSEFLAQMSHELRTPLHGLNGTIEILGRSSLDASQRRWIDLCRQSSQRLLSVIGDVLDFSRIESGKIELDSSPFCLQELVSSVSNSFAVAAQQKGLKLQVELPTGARTFLLGDALRLGQVLGNLLGNSVKFTAKGEIRVRVEVAPTAAGRAEVRWQVADTGCGIPADALPRVFDAFVQAEPAVTRRFGGTGLGLSIVKGLLGAMGGTIQVQSKVGTGTTFTVVTTHEIGAAPAAATHPDGIQNALRGVRVLVVDDQPVNRAIAEAMLVECGCAVELAPSGEDALDIAACAEFDVVLMDCHMPGMSGLEAARRLRQVGFRKPVLAVTADISPDNLAAITTHGMQGTLGKPFQQQELVRTIADVVGRSSSPAPARAKVEERVRAALAFDLDEAMKNANGSRVMLAQLAKLFLQHLPESIQSLRLALLRGDAAAQQKAAHALKGSSAIVGASELRDLTKRLEANGKAGIPEPQALTELLAAASACTAALQAFLGSSG